MTALSSDYVGRTYDCLILQGFSPLTQSKVDLSFGTGKVCAGIQKVAQEFVILFLTGRGSNPWDAERGTDFMPGLEKGLIYDENILQSSFQFAVSNILDYLDDKVPEDTPADERLADAELLEWDLNPGGIKIKVKVTSAAGDSIVFIIPTSF